MMKVVRTCLLWFLVLQSISAHLITVVQKYQQQFFKNDLKILKYLLNTWFGRPNSLKGYANWGCTTVAFCLYRVIVPRIYQKTGETVWAAFTADPCTKISTTVSSRKDLYAGSYSSTHFVPSSGFALGPEPTLKLGQVKQHGTIKGGSRIFLM